MSLVHGVQLLEKKGYQWLSSKMKSALGTRFIFVPLPNFAPEQQAVCETLAAIPNLAHLCQRLKVVCTLFLFLFFKLEFSCSFPVRPGML